ncbi:MAG: hypothetical protein K0R54_269 [Clostridiaceae bacterium]|jgi:hypothetical protein|nr:hypothetical protein [Clostridiaceae bacterium]
MNLLNQILLTFWVLTAIIFYSIDSYNVVIKKEYKTFIYIVITNIIIAISYVSVYYQLYIVPYNSPFYFYSTVVICAIFVKTKSMLMSDVFISYKKRV